MNDDVLNLLTSQPKGNFNNSIHNNFDISSINYQLNETKKHHIPSILNEFNLQKDVSNIDSNSFNSLEIEQKIRSLEKQAQLLQIDKGVNLSAYNEKIHSNDLFELREKLMGSIFNAKPVMTQMLHCESLSPKDNILNLRQNKEIFEDYEVLLENKKNMELANQECLANDLRMSNLAILK
jgi:hypothetical protein